MVKLTLGLCRNSPSSIKVRLDRAISVNHGDYSFLRPMSLIFPVLHPIIALFFLKLTATIFWIQVLSLFAFKRCGLVITDLTILWLRIGQNITVALLKKLLISSKLLGYGTERSLKKYKRKKKLLSLGSMGSKKPLNLGLIPS